jgi:hypothetical protein
LRKKQERRTAKNAPPLLLMIKKGNIDAERKQKAE